MSRTAKRAASIAQQKKRLVQKPQNVGIQQNCNPNSDHEIVTNVNVNSTENSTSTVCAPTTDKNWAASTPAGKLETFEARSMYDLPELPSCDKITPRTAQKYSAHALEWRSQVSPGERVAILPSIDPLLRCLKEATASETNGFNNPQTEQSSNHEPRQHRSPQNTMEDKARESTMEQIPDSKTEQDSEAVQKETRMQDPVNRNSAICRENDQKVLTSTETLRENFEIYSPDSDFLLHIQPGEGCADVGPVGEKERANRENLDWDLLPETVNDGFSAQNADSDEKIIANDECHRAKRRRLNLDLKLIDSKCDGEDILNLNQTSSDPCDEQSCGNILSWNQWTNRSYGSSPRKCTPWHLSPQEPWNEDQGRSADSPKDCLSTPRFFSTPSPEALLAQVDAPFPKNGNSN